MPGADRLTRRGTSRTAFEHGWFAAAWARDLVEPATAVQVGDRRLMLVRSDGDLRAFGADCPHRGAHLSAAVERGADHVVCPFHGYRIALGDRARGDFRAREHAVLERAGLAFVRLSDREDNGLAAALDELAADSAFVPIGELAVAADTALVIENGFDRRHFSAVHAIAARGFEVRERCDGAICVDGSFRVPAVGRFSADGDGRTSHIDYAATAFSPGVIVVRLSGANPYTVLTAATPAADGSTVMRLVLALPRAADGGEPRDEDFSYIVRYTMRGLEQDRAVWESLAPGFEASYTADDAPVLRFHEFCRRFTASSP